MLSYSGVNYIQSGCNTSSAYTHPLSFGPGYLGTSYLYITAGGNVGIGTTTPGYKLDVAGTGQFTNVLRITEATGTSTVPTTANTQPTSACNISVGSLTISHANNPGQSSIVFPHSTNTGSDYGYITYMDDVSNVAGEERSRLLIGAQNDPTNPVNSDALILQPFGGYLGIGQMNPAYALDVNGTTQVAGQLNVRSPAGPAVLPGYGSFTVPIGVAVLPNGNIVVADRNVHIIRLITPAGVVTTLAGTAGSGTFVDGTGAAARFK